MPAGIVAYIDAILPIIRPHLRNYSEIPSSSTERESINREQLQNAVARTISNGSRDLYEVTDQVLAAIQPYLKGET